MWKHEIKTVLETDTGGGIEYTQVDGRNVVKELGKLAPYLR